MDPKSFSATALSVAEKCLARYKAENLNYARGEANSAALTGSAVHNTLEAYVQQVYIDKIKPPSELLLLALFDISFMSVFGTADFDAPEYADGKGMIKNWFKNNDFTGRTVLSVEVKESFDIPTPAGPKPFNYIIDRFDQIGDPDEGVFEVVDYKSNRININHDDLRQKIQARCYALAMQIKYPQAKRIWVTFDMLRYSPIGVAFTREDNIKTWNFLKRMAKTIVEFPDDQEPPERLNSECKFCIRKTTCETLHKNIHNGGIEGLSLDDIIALKAKLDWQKKGLFSANEELEKAIFSYAKELDEPNLDTPDYSVSIGMTNRRNVDAERVEAILGPELYSRYGNRSMTLKQLDEALLDPELSDEQKAQLKAAIYMKPGAEKITIKEKGIFS